MSSLISRLALSAVLFAGSAAPSLAGWRFWKGRGHGRVRDTVHSVPEIDATAGLLAIAAVLVILLFVWERRRRAA
jgi:hypothetical protein